MNNSKEGHKECVWDYPRPPKIEPFRGEIKVEFNGKLIAQAHQAIRVLETSHPPVYFIHTDFVDMNCLFKRVRDYTCPFKGVIKLYDVVVDDRRSVYSAWYLPKPNPLYRALLNHIAFFAEKMDACYVDGELVIPQPGEFYGGWITSNIIGPYKGMPGTDNW